MIFLAVVDHDRKALSIHELANDTAHSAAVSKEKDKGRNVNCYTVSQARTRDEAVQVVTKTHPSYRLVRNALSPSSRD